MLAVKSKVCFSGRSGVGKTRPRNPITIWLKPPRKRNRIPIAKLTRPVDGAPYSYPELCCPYTQCYEYQERIYDEESPREDDRPFWLVCVLRFICQLERLDDIFHHLLRI